MFFRALDAVAAGYLSYPEDTLVFLSYLKGRRRAEGMYGFWNSFLQMGQLAERLYPSVIDMLECVLLDDERGGKLTGEFMPDQMAPSRV